MSNEFLKSKINTLEKVIEMVETQYSDLKEKNKILQKKLNNATETIKRLNEKLNKK